MVSSPGAIIDESVAAAAPEPACEAVLREAEEDWGSCRRITLGEHQRRRAEPRIVHLRLGQPTIAVNFIATRVPNRATRPYLPRSSSALVMRRQSPANLSRQMATGFGFDGCRAGTVVGIRSVRV